MKTWIKNTVVVTLWVIGVVLMCGGLWLPGLTFVNAATVILCTC